MRVSAKASLALAAVLSLLGPAAAQQAPAPAPVRLPPFLSSAEHPDAMALIGPPPAPGTPAQAADEAAYKTSRALAGSARWRQAIADVELRSEAAFKGWSCAAGVKISAQTTPVTAALLSRTLADAGLPPNAPKEHYKRPRPFVGNDAPVCVTRESLGMNWSYPSGHASVGWAWALMLAELKPERANAILVRGREFGDSRMVCGVHYPSDVEAGRLIGAAVVARLHSDPEFVAEMAKAKAELASATAPPEGCPAA
jgi:acid phosphatase (class A)